MAYIDTSLLVAYYCPELLSSQAQNEIDGLETPTLSHLVEVEFCSAVAQKIRTGHLDVTAANRIVSLLELHLAENLYRLVPVRATEYALARDWLGRFATPLRTLDALHLASAFANGLTILTTDQGLAQSASILGVDHRLVG